MLKLKTNLHFHTRDDPRDFIKYTFYEGVDRAAALGFEVIALTCHHKFVNKTEYEAYAESRGILLIPGVERRIENRDVVILNCDKEIEKINDFSELKLYREKNPGIFILAAHPYYYGNYSLKEKLEENIELFDAIESSWFYSKLFNRNEKAKMVAYKHDLPFIATSDTHDLCVLDKSYAVIEVGTKTKEAIFEAVRQKRFVNTTSPSRFFKEMVYLFGTREIRNLFFKLKNLFFPSSSGLLL